MSDFLSLEEAARSLGVVEPQLRQWIKSGLARASRRGGDYQLRLSEVERLRQEGVSIPTHLALPTVAETGASDEVSSETPQRRKALPPRTKDPDSHAGEKDRRRRMGRRASDFTLEILHAEIVKAVGGALSPILPRLEELERSLQAPAAPAFAPDPALAQLEAQNHELQLQQMHLEQAREAYRKRLEDSERERLRLEREIQAKPEPEAVQRLEAAHQQSELQRNRFEQALQVEVQRRERTEAERRQLEEELRSRAATPAVDPELLAQLQAERAQGREYEETIQRLREDLAEQKNAAVAVEAERARWSLESLSLQGEIDRLTSLHQSLESRLAEVPEDYEGEMRRLREQVNSLTYRLQMAGPGSSGPSPEESRRFMERLADAEAQMAEKDQLIHQNYAEIGDLRSKLEAIQRNYYELQQRYERVKEEWSQLAARQLNEFQQQQAAAQQQPPPSAPPSERNKGWGGIFRMRGDS